MYKITLEVFLDPNPTDEECNEVFLSLDGWQEQYTQFTDMFSYPRVVSVEKVEKSGKS